MAAGDCTTLGPDGMSTDPVYFWLGILYGSVFAFITKMLAVVMHIVLQHSRFGYRAQAMGSNPDAARLAGIPVDRTRIMVLTLMGLEQPGEMTGHSLVDISKD